MKKIRLLLITILLTALWSGCSNDNDWKENTLPVNKEDEVLLQLNMTVPGINSPETYALTQADENELKTIDILVFKEEAGDEYFLYRTHATDIDNKGGAANKKFKALLQKSTGLEKHRIVLITNARAAIDAVESNFETSKTKAEILELITFNTDVKWNTTSSSNFTPLPMWGEAVATHTITGTTTGVTIGTIKMLRSVARIDVGIKIDNNDIPQGLGTRFTMEDVKVYNANAKSRVVPLATNITNNKATLPSLVETPQVVTPAIPYAHTPANFGFIREIYVGEADNQTQTDKSKRFCVVLGGYYTKDGDPINTTTKTWYRIDFYKKGTNPQTRLDILRNHRYKVNITSVDGPGYETEEEAFKSKPINIEAEIIAWDEADMNDITSDGQYQLTVDKTEITLYQEGNLNPQKLRIYTDHPSGWTIDYEGNTWIQVAPDNDNSGNELEVDVTADPYLNQADPRETGFWIKAGKMKQWIKVKQLNQPELTIDVTPTQIVFRKSGIPPKSVVVTTFPLTSLINFTTVQGVNPISWFTFPISGGVAGTYSFQPDPNNTGNVLTATVVVSTTDPVTGMMVSKNVTVMQLATDLLFAATVNNPYPSTAGNYTFSVDSDTPWSIASVTDPSNALSAPFDNTEKPAGTGTIYTFPLSQNDSWILRDVTFTPTADDIDFIGLPIAVQQKHPDIALAVDKTNIAFGSQETPGTQSVKVTSNAEWQYTTSGSWTDAVASASPTDGTTQGSHTYHNPATDVLVNLTPKTWTPTLGVTPPAGTNYLAEATFTTQTGSSSGEKTHRLNISRMMPAFFTQGPFSPTSVPRIGDIVRVHANTNAVWQVTPSIGNVQTDGPAIYEAKFVDITIPENTTWASGTTPENRNISINTKYGINASSLTETGGSATVTQPGYYIASAYYTPSTTPPSDQATTTTVGITGAYPQIRIRIWNKTINEAETAEKMIEASEGAEGTNTLDVPPNETWNPKELAWQYWHPGKSQWINIADSQVQKGYEVTASDATQVTAIAGGQSTVSLTGWRPDIEVRLLVDGAEHTTGIVTGGSGTNTTDLEVPENKKFEQRTIQVQGKIRGGDTDYSIKSWKQLAKPKPGVDWKGMRVDANWRRIETPSLRAHRDAEKICENEGGKLMTRNQLSTFLDARRDKSFPGWKENEPWGPPQRRPLYNDSFAYQTFYQKRIDDGPNSYSETGVHFHKSTCIDSYGTWSVVHDSFNREMFIGDLSLGAVAYYRCVY